MAQNNAAAAAASNNGELREALGEAREALVKGVKASGVNSLKLGFAVTVVAFSAQLAVLGAVAAIGAGQGVLKGINTVRNTAS
jgi:hypothetical protein